MPTAKKQYASRYPVLMQVTSNDPEVIEAVQRFNKYAVGFRNKGKALVSLLDKAKIA